MTVATRPRKRPRAASYDDQKHAVLDTTWNNGLVALVDRLDSIRSEAVTLRDEHLKSIAELDSKATLCGKAKRAVAQAVIPPQSDDYDVFAKAVAASSTGNAGEAVVPIKNPTPAMKLLMETEPPEKIIHEQSIIVRAQAINRKNAELARERLPKQPEAQRSKTHHDYYVDEAIWMATDFREERKLKIQLARKVSRMVVQYHNQRQRRDAKARLEAQQRILKIASTIAREVRKFWSQIGEIADYRSTLVEEARQTDERREQLKQLVDQTDQYTKRMARSLRDPSETQSAKKNSYPLKVQQGKLLEAEPTELEDGRDVETSLHDPSVLGNKSDWPDSSVDRTASIHALEQTETSDGGKTSPTSDSEREYEQADKMEFDDESTLLAAEAEGGDDPAEINTLTTQASMSVDELLRSQGIDPSVYKADKKDYLTGGEGDSDEANVVDNAENADVEEYTYEDENDSDNEITIAAAEAEMGNDAEEGRRLQDENEKSIEALLREQGINPEVYFADRKNYLEGDESPGNRGTIAKLADEDQHESESDGEDTDVKQSMHIDSDGLDAQNPADLEVLDTPSLQDLKEQTPVKLLRGALRSYQQAGMEWLVSLHKQKMNGILADEMGLGKTIQTIALLAWLAEEQGKWGPHLIVVPTSVLVNWEVEFKKWLPGFKIMTYFGSMKERKLKRQGWTKPNLFHVCITSYRLAVQDATILRRKKWMYLILDEAHNIKNFESQRWQTLLSFSSQRRLLITGTPLQNSVMELWSLMHFLTPDIFNSHSEFKGWFSKPLIKAAEAENENSADRAKVVANLHRVLRPFLLRRLKADVEKGLPPKFEHVIKCHLSKRQRQLYEDFISRNDVKETLESENLEGIVSVLIQLKKVCNHPDLFEGRPILSPFSMSSIFFAIPSCVPNLTRALPGPLLDMRLLNFELVSHEQRWSGGWYADEADRLSATGLMKRQVAALERDEDLAQRQSTPESSPSILAQRRRITARREILSHQVLLNAMRIRQRGLLGEDLRSVVTLTPSSLLESLRLNVSCHDDFIPHSTPHICRRIEQVSMRAKSASERFVCCITKATAPLVEMRYQGDDMQHRRDVRNMMELTELASAYRSLFRSYEVRSQVTIPDARLVQWDCGKLQVMARLLRELRARDSRVLIFTQMAKVLDVLESFLNLHSYRYLRLDGTTKTDDRQKIVERFNTDRRVFCMILTTRAGGVGLNLTGANSVIFYDTDYNPAIDNQAQDRAHRIGQTKPVNVYRLVSEQTVEESILKRANEKRSLEAAVISEAGFTTEAIAESDASKSKPHNPLAAPANGPHNALHSNAASVKSGLGLASEAPNGTERESHPNGDAKRTGGSKQESHQIAESGRSAVACSHGKFNGFLADEANDGFRANTGLDVRSIDEYQQVAARILAKDDEREKLAQHLAEQEEQELRAEFEDSKPESADNTESPLTPRKSVLTNYDKIKSSLTPVQLYALRLVERWQDGDRESHDTSAEPHGMQKELLVDDVDDVLLPDADDTPKRDHEWTSLPEDHTDAMFYELDATDAGQVNYLKVLTDADADIRLYLPLRDGGPEELKISSVVSGTAAAGLECAEDAAFFPHAYNRMSRTPFATRRQREKGLANFRKRKAEKEAKRQRELQWAAASAAAAAAAAEASRQQSSVVDSRALQNQAHSIASATERTKSTKKQLDASRPGSLPFSKKQRVDNMSRGKAGMSSGSMSNIESAHNSSMGLFRRTSKKNSRRLSLPGGKSSLVSSTSGMPGEGLGSNDGWTAEEDQQLLSKAPEFNNNMILVADLLSSDPRVAAGLRRYRSHTHCIDRLINCLGKDKSGPPSAKASSTDEEVFRNHQKALKHVINKTHEKPFFWLNLPPATSDLHASHKKAIAQAAAKMAGPAKRDRVPPFKAVLDANEIPKHFKPGYKTTETTPQALSKLRYPFLRHPRDDPRALHQRGTGQPSRYNGAPSGQGPLHRGDPNLFSKTSQKAIRNQGQQSGSQRNVSQGRGSGPSRTPNPAKARIDSNPSRSVATSSALQHSSAIPASLHPSRKGYIVPGTGGRISIGQYGNTVQHTANAPAYGTAHQKLGGLQPSVTAGTGTRVAAAVTSLKPGSRKMALSRIQSMTPLKSRPQGAVPKVPAKPMSKTAISANVTKARISPVPGSNGVPGAKAPVSAGGTFIGGKGSQNRTVAGVHPDQSLTKSAPPLVTKARVTSAAGANPISARSSSVQVAKNSGSGGNQAKSSSASRVGGLNGTKTVHRGPARVPEQSRVPEASASGVRAAETGAKAGQVGADGAAGVVVEKTEAHVAHGQNNAVVKTAVDGGTGPAVEVQSTVADKQRPQKAPATSQENDNIG